MGLIIPYVGLSHSRYINSMDKSETTIVTDVTDETDTTGSTTLTFDHQSGIPFPLLSALLRCPLHSKPRSSLLLASFSFIAHNGWLVEKI